MNEPKTIRKRIWGRLLVVLLLGIVIGKLLAYLSDIFMGEYTRINHFFLAVITTILTMTFILVALKFDKISWKQLGQGTLKSNTYSFFLGFFLWTIPAMIGLIICVMLGWVEIIVQTDMSSLFLGVLILFITVFLIEALPEEFLFRGLIYRYLQVLYPHWLTVVIQTLFFTAFAYFIGAMYSIEQIQFIPGFAIMLGIFRAVSGNVWTSIGFHVAIMTATQIMGPVHGHFDVSDIYTLRFIAFILLPSVIGATALSFIYSNHNWRKKESLL